MSCVHKKWTYARTDGPSDGQTGKMTPIYVAESQFGFKINCSWTNIYRSNDHMLFLLISGAIFDWDDKPAEAGFLFAISNFNSKKEEFQLSAIADVINVKDSFNLAQSSKF